MVVANLKSSRVMRVRVCWPVVVGDSGWRSEIVVGERKLWRPQAKTSGYQLLSLLGFPRRRRYGNYHQQNDHNYHAIDHVLSTILRPKNRPCGSLNPEDFAPKTEINPKKRWKLTTTHHKCRGVFLSTAEWSDLTY
jgi:hypothetical protein